MMSPNRKYQPKSIKGDELKKTTTVGRITAGIIRAKQLSHVENFFKLGKQGESFRTTTTWWK